MDAPSRPATPAAPSAAINADTGDFRAAAAPPWPTQFISFAIGDDQYGVDIMAVREIKGWSQITHLPKQPDYVRGVLNLRGVIVPIIDLRCRFGQGLTEATPLHIVIIVQIGPRQVGLLPTGCSTSSRSTSQVSRCPASRTLPASSSCPAW